MNKDFPKITLPDVSEEDRLSVESMLDEVSTQLGHTRAQQVSCIAAMLRLKKPIAHRGHPKRKRRQVTKHSRYVATMRTRSAFLKDAA